MTIFPSIDNARDLGGTIVPDGRRVRQGLLLRGGALHKASDEDLARLRDEYHVAAVFDFRTSMEVEHHPDREIEGARHFWMPAFDENGYAFKNENLPQSAFQNLGEWLVEHSHEELAQNYARKMYTEMIDNEFSQIQYAGFLQNIVSTENGAVYWHCSQGKDRTGVGAALLLAALGCDRKEILREYLLSEDFYRADFEKYIGRVETEEEKKVIRTFMSVNPDYFELALDLIDSKYGSMAEFLTGPLCLSSEDISTLRERYLE